MVISSLRRMGFKNEPVIWINAITGLLSAFAVAGLIQQDDADRFGPMVAAGVPVLFLVANLAAAAWARSRTAPVDAGTAKVKVLSLSDDGVYRKPSDKVVADARRNEIRRADLRSQL
jgi:hypothetical protein